MAKCLRHVKYIFECVQKQKRPDIWRECVRAFLRESVDLRLPPAEQAHEVLLPADRRARDDAPERFATLSRGVRAIVPVIGVHKPAASVHIYATSVNT